MVKNFFSCLFVCTLLISCSNYTEKSDSDHNIYVSPLGAGDQSGADAKNAIALTDQQVFSTLWQDLQAGDTLFLGAGIYEIPEGIILNSGGTATAPKVLMGEAHGGKNMVIFKGPWQWTDQQRTSAIKVAKGVSNWVIAQLNIKHFYYGVETTGQHENIQMNHLLVDHMNDGILLLGGATTQAPLAGTKNVQITDCQFTHYSKRGIRIKGGNNKVVIRDCDADQGGEAYWYEGNFPMSYQVSDNRQSEKIIDRDIQFINVSGGNNFHKTKSKALKGYWNADGFTAERHARDIQYINCVAYNNTDGGWDDKSPNPVLKNCKAINNKRSYRFWAFEAAKLYNCLSIYPTLFGGVGDSYAVWAGKEARLELYNCTLFNSQHEEIGAEGGTVVLKDCIIANDRSDRPLTVERFGGKVIMDESNVTFSNGTEGEDPKFNDPALQKWYELTDQFNSKTFKGAKGYHFPNKKAST
ncbi:hypothetical protein [Persicobacter psychrovividus]|uniref:Right handed beta helix domain-containing protein n=1 Tax=Persicobacter psychrovividus TaxID=387638 RepID=A0ABN6LD79_9BACT|nr:hypothetical protein PEPS_30990 [Persicobacter psychrovividus]